MFWMLTAPAPSAFPGTASAMAQCFNHMIMPLANTRDKRTQVRWGIEDFRHRYGRDPEGMWLPEGPRSIWKRSTFLLATSGISFTGASAPCRQRARQLGGPEWKDVVGGSRIDPHPGVPREVLASGRSIAPCSSTTGPSRHRGSTFEGLLSTDGEDPGASGCVGGVLRSTATGRSWRNIAAGRRNVRPPCRAHGDMALGLRAALTSGSRRTRANSPSTASILEKHPPRASRWRS